MFFTDQGDYSEHQKSKRSKITGSIWIDIVLAALLISMCVAGFLM